MVPHNSCVLEYEIRDGEVYVTLLPYRYVTSPKSKIDGYRIPGGKAEPNEAPEDTARRELREETGRRIRTRVCLLDRLIQEGHIRHLKFVFLVPARLCRGRYWRGERREYSLYLKPPIQVTLDEALKLIPESWNTHYRNALLEAREHFKEQGIITDPALCVA